MMMMRSVLSFRCLSTCCYGEDKGECESKGEGDSILKPILHKMLALDPGANTGRRLRVRPQLCKTSQICETMEKLFKVLGNTDLKCTTEIRFSAQAHKQACIRANTHKHEYLGEHTHIHTYIYI